MRPLAEFATQRTMLGTPIKPGDMWMQMMESAIPTPISADAAYHVAKQAITGQHSEIYAGEFQKQAMASVGIKTDQAQSPKQRIRKLASDFAASNGKPPDPAFYTGDYTPLTKAISLGNQTDARNAMAQLVKTKTRAAIFKHYRTFPNFPFTGVRRIEAKFVATLNPEQKQQYQKARDSRRRIASEALALLRSTK